MLTSFQKIQCQQPHQQHTSSNSHQNTTHNNTINNNQQITGSPIDAPADCTIACERGHINAHKLILCAHSKYLREILGKFPTAEHPIVILTELNVTDIKILVNYMYTGELIINDEMSTSSLLRAAQILKIDSLTAPDEQDDDDDDDNNDNNRNQNCTDDMGIHNNNNNNNINSNNNRDDINNNRGNRVNNRNKRNRTNNTVGIGNNVHENDDVAYDDDDIVEDDIIDDENIVEDGLDLDARDVTNQTIDMINSIKSIDSIYQFLNSTTTTTNNNNNNAAITINKNANTNITATRLATNTINASTATTTYESFDDIIDNNNHQHNMDCDSLPSSPIADGLVDCNRSKLAAGTGNTLNCFGNKGASSIVASIANQATFHHNQQNLKNSSIDSKELSKIRCHLCNIGLSDVKCLYRHVLTRHLPEKWGYKCEFCDREFSRDDHLMRHYTTKHKNMEFNREKIRETRRLNREMAKNFHDQMSSAHGLQLD